jgi:hypothetical protein
MFETMALIVEDINAVNLLHWFYGSIYMYMWVFV